MLENSGFLTSDNPKLVGPKPSKIKNINIRGIKHSDSNDSLSIGEITHRVKDNQIEEILGSEEHQKERILLGIKNFSVAKLFTTDTKFYYIWSVHLSQFMVSILIGIVLQLLWEDRPITEPL
jgi:hypothetical protein